MGIAIFMLTPPMPPETCAVRSRAYAEAAVERAPHGLDGPEAALPCDDVDARLRALERDARLLDPDRLDVRGGRHAGLAPERAREVARAHGNALGQRGHRQVLADVRRDPGLQ